MNSLTVMRTYLFLICVIFLFLHGDCGLSLTIQPRNHCPDVATVIKNNFNNTVENICKAVENSHVANFVLPEPILCSAVKYFSRALCDKHFEQLWIDNALKKSASRICDYYTEMRLHTDKEIPPNYNKLFETNLTCEKTCTDILNGTHPLCRIILFANCLLSSNEDIKQEPGNVAANGGINNMISISQSHLNEGISSNTHSNSPSSPDGLEINKQHSSVLQEKGLEDGMKPHITKETETSDTNSVISAAAAAAAAAAAVVDNKHKIEETPSDDQILKSENNTIDVEAANTPSKVKDNGKNQEVSSQAGTKNVVNNAENDKGGTDSGIKTHQGDKIVDSGNSSNTENIDHQQSKDKTLNGQKPPEQLKNIETITEGEAESQSSKHIVEHDHHESTDKPLSEQKNTQKLSNAQSTAKEVIKSQNSEVVQVGKAEDDTPSSPKPVAIMDVNVNSVPVTSMDDLTVSKEHYTDSTGRDPGELGTRYPVGTGELSDNTDYFSGGGTGVDDARPASGVLVSGGGTGVDGARPASDAFDIVKTGVDPGTAVLHDNYKYDEDDSHFFAYFMTTMIFCIVGYLLFHNKQKILALALEGRARRGRRRPNTSGYRKLDSNLEEAIGSSKNSSVTQIIY